MFIPHPSEITVSEVHYSDLRCLAEIKQLALRSHQAKKIVSKDLIDLELYQGSLRILAEGWRDNTFDVFIKAENNNGDILGYLAASDLDYKDVKVSEILQFYTLPLYDDKNEMKQVKPGSKLMRRCLFEMHCRNIEEVVLEPTPYALPIYWHYGFESDNYHGMHLTLSNYLEYKVLY